MIKEFTNGVCIPDIKSCIIFLNFSYRKKSTNPLEAGKMSSISQPEGS